MTLPVIIIATGLSGFPNISLVFCGETVLVAPGRRDACIAIYSWTTAKEKVREEIRAEELRYGRWHLNLPFLY
jgi:hypothetical protein